MQKAGSRLLYPLLHKLVKLNLINSELIDARIEATQTNHAGEQRIWQFINRYSAVEKRKRLFFNDTELVIFVIDLLNSHKYYKVSNSITHEIARDYDLIADRITEYVNAKIAAENPSTEFRVTITPRAAISFVTNLQKRQRYGEMMTIDTTRESPLPGSFGEKIYFASDAEYHAQHETVRETIQTIFDTLGLDINVYTSFANQQGLIQFEQACKPTLTGLAVSYLMENPTAGNRLQEIIKGFDIDKFVKINRRSAGARLKLLALSGVLVPSILTLS